MPYNVNISSFYELDEQVKKLPNEIPSNPDELERLLFLYLNAFNTILELCYALMGIIVEKEQKRKYTYHFLPVFRKTQTRVVELLRMEIKEALENSTVDLYELSNAIRDSQISSELVALGNALEESESYSEPEDHLTTTTTVVNSLKEQIEKHTKRKWIKSVLHTLNEVIGIIRGVVV